MGDRFCERLHLNLISLFLRLFGNYHSKVAFDLVRRPHYAYPVLRAEMAVAQGVGAITIVESGVATGAGLLNLCNVAQRSSEGTGVRIDVVGFDTGLGLPRPHDYRDHPELFQEGTSRWTLRPSPKGFRAMPAWCLGRSLKPSRSSSGS